MGGWGKGGSRGTKGYGKSGGGRRVGVISSIGKQLRQSPGMGGRRAAKGGNKGFRQGGFDGFLERGGGFLDRDVPDRRESKGFGKNRGGGGSAWGNTLATFGRKGKGKQRMMGGGQRMMGGGKGKGKRRFGGDDFEYSERPRAGSAFGFAKGKSSKGYGRAPKGGGKFGGGGMRGFEDVLALPPRRAKGKGKAGSKGKGKRQRGWGVIATISKKGQGRTKGKGKGKGSKAGGRGSKGKGKGRKGGKGKGKGKGRGKGLSKEALDKQLEEYMGPDAIKAVLDEELDNYFGTNKKVVDVTGDAADKEAAKK